MLKVGQTVTPKLNIPKGLQIHVAQYQPTERPIEDRFSVDVNDDGNRLVIGVYDGHGGPETADHVSKTLPLRLLAHSPSDHAQQFEELDKSMMSDFAKDHSLFHRKSPNWAHHAELMKSGSAALIVDVDLLSSSAHYANAGDCRLVICDPCDRGSVQFQTSDLNVKTKSEQDRISREHPNEDQIIVGDRLFGRLMCTRGFGDGYYKLSKGLLGDSQHRRYIDTISSIERKGKIPMNAQYASLFYAYKTPPYITARPDTGTFHLKNASVIVLATDGLWDLISSQEAASIVQQGLSSDEKDLAKYLLDKVKETTPPGDDITVIVIQGYQNAQPPTSLKSECQWKKSDVIGLDVDCANASAS